MLYYLYSADGYGDYNDIGLYEGPEGLDLPALMGAFISQMTWEGLGKPVYPEYKGPMVPYQPSPGGCFSGSIPIGTPIAVSCPEYGAYQAQHRRISEEWYVRQKAKEAEIRAKYPGTDYGQMFLSYLKAEHGFREVPCQAVNL